MLRVPGHPPFEPAAVPQHARKSGCPRTCTRTCTSVIPVHTHLCDEYLLVVSGTVVTGGRHCEADTFWFTPANSRQGPHVAVTDVELLTCRLGAMGSFES